MLMLSALLLALAAPLRAADLAGVVVRLEGYEGPATVSARVVGPFQIQLTVDPATETKALAIRVELPETGPRAWPAADVEVRDAQGKALLVRRAGTEWSKLLVRVPAVAGTYLVRAAPRPEPAGLLPSEKERWLVDDVSGLRLGIAKWHGGRKAAMSLRFDDSHPTHLTKAVPILREYGFRGTFMVNPGQPESGRRWRSDFQEHLAEWAAVARQGDHELANHTAHHRGATGDEDMEAEIGEAAQAIWRLTPGKSRLLALNLGGGTHWETTRTLRYYLEKYHLFDASSGSLGMDDVYGDRVAAFRQHLARHLERGLWCRVHFHAIGQGPGTSEANFRAALDIAKKHQSELWIAGMADIYKYQTERNASKLRLRQASTTRLCFELVCLTDAALFDQPLTIAVTHPPSRSADRVLVRDAQGRDLPLRTAPVDGASAWLFDVAPRNSLYSIEKKP
ncbi:MAG: polysaccharide deacetylase family protein [Thermoguttaceae bacterium]|nr:polysaccharide deacetylase family protein [Thermoguttaceae bacterium]